MSHSIWTILGTILFIFVISSNGQECYGINSGIDFTPGSNDIAFFEAIDLGQCCKECQDNARCLTFLWQISRSWCWLKDVTGPTVPNPDIISGFKYNSCGSKGNCRKVQSGIDYSPYGPYDMGVKEDVDLDRCCASCRSNSTCRAFVWSKSTKRCLLKSAGVQRTRNDDVISGLVE